MSENFEQKKIPKWTPQEERDLAVINKIIDEHTKKISEGKISVEMLAKRFNTIKSFEKNFEEGTGLRLKDYLLWHRIIGSTPPEDVVLFDTPKHDIEYFIKHL